MPFTNSSQHSSNVFLCAQLCPQSSSVHIPYHISKIHVIIHNFVLHVFEQDAHRPVILEVQPKSGDLCVEVALARLVKDLEQRHGRGLASPRLRGKCASLGT